MDTTIELNKFITKTLVDIATGVSTANANLKEITGKGDNYFMLETTRGDKNKTPGIAFDIAVSANKDQKDKAGFLVSLVNIGGGASTEKGNKSEMAHRIKFEVGMRWEFT